MLGRFTSVTTGLVAGAVALADDDGAGAGRPGVPHPAVTGRRTSRRRVRGTTRGRGAMGVRLLRLRWDGHDRLSGFGHNGDGFELTVRKPRLLPADSWHP
ncbi:hypothetical protein Acsp01_24690 [Actinoplanes sp. NBRC 101535]|nr:hypothetical protein Acsp01_24690 [Actinoplanes sp. NBRC 101535]